MPWRRTMFHVLRHGETEWNREGRFQGHRDSPLTDLGRAQAAALGRTVARLGPEPATLEMWSSPLGRALATAAIVADVLGRDPAEFHTDDRLKELAYGDWEGLSATEIRRRDAAAYDRRYADKWRNPIPGGESYRDGYRRARSWAAGRDPARPHLVVGHGALNRMLVAALTGRDPETLLDLGDPQDAVIVVDGTDWRFEAAD